MRDGVAIVPRIYAARDFGDDLSYGVTLNEGPASVVGAPVKLTRVSKCSACGRSIT